MGRASSIFIVIAQLVPIAMAVLVAMFYPAAVEAPGVWALVTVIAFAVGFVVFVSAKVPMLGKAQWWWLIGPRHMPPPLRTRYWAGYIIMSIALVMTVVLAGSVQLR
jgi:hypothetical protein